MNLAHYTIYCRYCSVSLDKSCMDHPMHCTSNPFRHNCRTCDYLKVSTSGESCGLGMRGNNGVVEGCIKWAPNKSAQRWMKESDQ